MHSYHTSLATSTLSSFSPCAFTGQHQIFIASLFFKKPSTSISQLFCCTCPSRFFPFLGEEGPFRDLFSDDLSSSIGFWLLTRVFKHTFGLYLKSFCPFPSVFPCLPLSCVCVSCLGSKAGSSSSLHAEVFGKRREPWRHWGRVCTWPRGYGRRRRGQYWRQISSSGDDLLLTVSWDLLSFTSHHLLHCLHWILERVWWYEKGSLWARLQMQMC